MKRDEEDPCQASNQAVLSNLYGLGVRKAHPLRPGAAQFKHEAERWQHRYTVERRT